jgi:hypothetical protein
LAAYHRADQAAKLPVMSSETETLALHLVRLLYDSSDGLPQQWRMLEKLDEATAEPIQFAVARGWLAPGLEDFISSFWLLTATGVAHAAESFST